MLRTRTTLIVLLCCGVTTPFAAPREFTEAPGLPPPATDADFATFSDAQIELGKFLFYDKILSGNENISCATCHHALADTGDGLSLPVGEGGRGLGVCRDTGEWNGTPIIERVPRNAPHLFNLGAHEFTTLFHDGRVEADPDQPGGYKTPAGSDLPDGLVSVLAAQALFPVTSNTEMAGQEGENAVADAAGGGDLVAVWDLLTQRVASNDEYAFLFGVAFDDVQGPEDVTFAHVANAIATFEATAWRSDDSPFDRYLRGDKQAMSLSARKGMHVFYKVANCDRCHSGTFQTDQQFHSIGMPQVGPGKGDGFDGYEDYGRERVTGDPADRYRFRTPTLRNVALTGPWGHDGAYNSLEAVVRHNQDVATALENYDPNQLVLPSRRDLDAQDYVVVNDRERMRQIGASSELPVIELTEAQIANLLDFLNALTDPSTVDLRGDVPDRLPSELSLAE